MAHISYATHFKKQLKAEKRAGGSDVESLLDGDLSLGNIIKFAQKNPEMIAQFKDALGSVTSQKPAIDDKSAFSDGRLR